MLTPKPHQIAGAAFLAARRAALLADEPRCGKTGAAIMAADQVGARSILVVTTASGRPVWRRGFEEWSIFGRSCRILTSKDRLRPDTEIAIVGWPDMSTRETAADVFGKQWDVIILDESHFAKSVEAERAVSVFSIGGLHTKGERCWCLSGTPAPNTQLDLYPMLIALAQDRLAADPAQGWPDVRPYDQFKRRYCKIKPKKIGFHRWIDVIIGGQNLDELAARLDGFYLRRTQQDVGITEPIFEIMPLLASPAALREAQKAEASAIDAAILSKIANGNLDDLKQDHLGPVRRVWGGLKVKPLVEALKDEFESGLDKVVIAAWHSDVIAALADGLAKFGVVGIDGSTSAKAREANVHAFQTDPNVRVFIGQIQAAGEAIDLSAAAELIFAESSFVPAHMAQMSMRVTNFGQARNPRVRVATLEGSIDDAIQTALLRKWSSIKEIIK